MRSEDSSEAEDVCNDPFVQAACLMGSDKCPAACQEAEKEDNTTDDETVVKSGDLAVSAEAADGRKVLIGGISDLDTLTFKTSEEVSISRITLERYGYSTNTNIRQVWLENEDGVKITDPKRPNSKGQVNLTIKKDYKSVDGSYTATVVVETANGSASDLAEGLTELKAGATLGFKVVSTESTAENLNLKDYTPYTYEAVSYDGTALSFTVKTANKEYNFEAGESYEVAKFKVKAPSDSAILVKGFTLKNRGTLDDKRYLSDIEVSLDGETIKSAKYEINKNNELVISFNEIEFEPKQNSTFSVKAILDDGFDQFTTSNVLQYELRNISDFNAVDKKTNSRVKEDTSVLTSTLKYAVDNNKWSAFTFKGGKIRITNEKLGRIDAAQGSQDVVVAQGKIEVTEPLTNGSFSVTFDTANIIEELTMVVAGEEFDSTPNGGYTTFTFNGVDIEKSGKIQFKANIFDDADLNATVKATSSIDTSSFTSLKYEESNKSAKEEIVGSISFSEIRVQAARANLENGKTKDVEFVKNELSRKVIFDGTYEAKKSNVELSKVVLSNVATTPLNVKATYYVFINDQPVTDFVVPASTTTNIEDTFTNVKVEAGKSVNVRVEAELTPNETTTYAIYNVKLSGEDENGNDAGEANDDTWKIVPVVAGTLDIDSSARNTVLLRSDRNIAEFTVKPSKSSEDEITLNSISFKIAGTDAATEAGKLRVRIDGDEEKYNTTDSSCDTTVCTLVYKPGAKVPAEGIKVSVSLKNEVLSSSEVALTVYQINTNTINRIFKKYYVGGVIKVAQEGDGTSLTKYTVTSNKESGVQLSNLRFYIGTEAACKSVDSNNSDDGIATACGAAVATHSDVLSDSENTMEADNDGSSHTITVITYDSTENGTTTKVVLHRGSYEDYFTAVGGGNIRVFANK